MGNHITKFGLHKEAMKEVLESVCLLLNYDKSKKPSDWEDKIGCLGIPAMILLCSYINAFGNLFHGEKINGIKIRNDKNTFQILNSEYFGQNLSKSALDNLYDIYRNKLTHNLSLQDNYSIQTKSDERWFELTKNQTGKEAISTVYLKNLFKLCNEAYKKLELENHKEMFENSPKYDEISYPQKSIFLDIKNLKADSTSVVEEDKTSK